MELCSSRELGRIASSLEAFDSHRTLLLDSSHIVGPLPQQNII